MTRDEWSQFLIWDDVSIVIPTSVAMTISDGMRGRS